MKKNQHYVWRHYLKPWTKNDKIWCKRDEKIFNTSLNNVAQENYFYVLETLSSDELAIIRNILDKIDETAIPVMESNIDILVKASNSKGDEKKEYLENYHTFIENIGKPLLESLYKGDLEMLNIQRNRDNFSYFLGLQYTRTKKIRHSLMKDFEPLFQKPEHKTINIETISHALAFLSADFLGNWISSDGNFTLIRNNTDIDFLTSDQPIYNHAFNFESWGSPEQMELFYPITPSLGLLISSKKIPHFDASSELISYYNNKLVSESEEFIFSTNESQLK
ncbi:DUF4238 domain-containing protein [Leptospira idonii]|uniref:DUF4238 domain-containing protein n=1 Tax=Leptospira idonii TaxID=1193500 RepID=A0A4R9LWX4_9LEPT|nr:DUF4238 domain-containing protein [Leptospira idonii]TGN17782.1 DUF4238 domain-containing protein [Leptospira idonii]